MPVEMTQRKGSDVGERRQLTEHVFGEKKKAEKDSAQGTE